MTTLKKPAAVQRKFIYWERGWGLDLKKHLRKTDPFVIEFSWKFLPGLGCREAAVTPLCAGQFCCFAAVWYLLGGVLVGCCSTAISSGTKLSWGSFCSFSSCALFPCWQCIPALQLDIPLVREFFVWHLCALHYGKSLSWEQSFPSSSFWRESPAGDSHVVRSKARAWYEARDQGCYKSWGWGEHKAVNILVNPIQYVVEKSIALKLLSTLYNSRTGYFLPSEVQWGGSQHCCEVVPSSEGEMCTDRSRQSPGIPGLMAPAHRVGCPEQSHTQHGEGAQPGRLQTIWASNEQPINWLLKI